MYTGLGIDGCSAGWLAVQFDGQHAQAHLVTSITEINSLAPQSPIWIDMPIGLVEKTPLGRECDKLARRILSPLRHSSVFTPPCRAAVYAQPAEASAINQQHTTKKLTRQSINILPKIKELDCHLQALAEDEQLLWHEAHPEVVFAAFQGLAPLRHSKKTTLGQTQRQLLLKKHFPNITPWLTATKAKFSRADVKIDDILDALALAIGAHLVSCGQAQIVSLPETLARDTTGLPMRIVYAKI